MKKDLRRLALDLQRHAVQTTELKGSGNDLSPEMKTHYSNTLIDLAGPELVHDQFGQQENIPRNGGKTIEFRKYSRLNKALTPLTEGVTPEGNKLDVTAITAKVNQYGDFITISDLLELTAIDKNIVQALKLLGEQAGATLDTITREELNGGTNVYYVPKREDGAETETASRDALTAGCELTLMDVFIAVAILKNMNARKIDGHYVAIIHPYTAMGLMTEAGPAWMDIMKYAKPEAILNGEIGSVAGVRFVETTEAKIFDGQGADGASVFSTLFLGDNAYGTTELVGGGLETIVKQRGSSGTADPLNQRSSVGWKATKAVKRLVEEYMVRVEHTVKAPFDKAKNADAA